MALVKHDTHGTSQYGYVPYSTGTDTFGSYIADVDGQPVYDPVSLPEPNTSSASSSGLYSMTNLPPNMEVRAIAGNPVVVYKDSGDEVSNDVLKSLKAGNYAYNGSNSAETDIGTYLSGMFTSVGYENAKNRAFNSAEAAAQREWASHENQLARDFNERMSNTAYQRTVADLQAAGLNPILAVAQGGSAAAASPTGSGSSGSYQAGGGDSLSQILNAVANVASAVADFIPSKSINTLIKQVAKK